MTRRVPWPRTSLAPRALRGAVAFAGLTPDPVCPDCRQAVPADQWTLHRRQLCPGPAPRWADRVRTELADLPELPRQLLLALGRAADAHGLPNVFFPGELVDHYGCPIRPMDQPRVLQTWDWFGVGCNRLGWRVQYAGQRYHVDLKPTPAEATAS